MKLQLEQGSQGSSDILSALGDGLGDAVEVVADVVSDGALEAAGELLVGIIGSIFE